MTGQVFYQDVAVDSEIPPLKKHPTTRQLVMWATASRDYSELHYDQDFARRTGLKGVVVHGRLGLAWLGQLVTGWMGEAGTLKKLSAEYRRLLYPGTDVTCRGRIVEKYLAESEHCVRLELWLEDSNGQTVTTGAALVSLPARNEEPPAR